MRPILHVFLSAAILIGLHAPFATVLAATPAQDQQALAQRVKGRFLLAVEDHGKLWYVKPQNGMRVYITDQAALSTLVQSAALVISGKEMSLLPTTNLQSLSAEAKAAVTTYRGHFVASFDAPTKLWYVSPADNMRHDVSTPDLLYAVAIKQSMGIDNLNLSLIPAEPEYIVKPQPLPRPTIKTRYQKPATTAPKNTTSVKDAQMAWDFASGMWRAYEQYHRSFNDYPELKWFENIVGFNLPIYFNETGFSLDSGKENYFVWNDFSAEWKDFYKNHFSMKREMDKDLAYIKFDLPAAVDTTQYGRLAPGTYYFTNKQGLVTQANFGKAAPAVDTISIDEKKTDAKRVFEQALAVAKALEKYRDDVHGYPIAYERAIELGENGATNLCFYGGFGCHSDQPNNITYIENIQTGWPSTKLTYDSRYDGRSFIIAFTIYGKYDQYEPGKYEIGPYTIIKVADLTASAGK